MRDGVNGETRTFLETVEAAQGRVVAALLLKVRGAAAQADADAQAAQASALAALEASRNLLNSSTGIEELALLTTVAEKVCSQFLDKKDE